MVSSTPRPHFTPEKDPVAILKEAGWASGPVWTGGKPCPHRDSIPDRPSLSHSLYRLSYRAHKIGDIYLKIDFLLHTQEVFVSVTQNNWLMPHKEVIHLYSEKNMYEGHIYTSWEKLITAVLNVVVYGVH